MLLVQICEHGKTTVSQGKPTRNCTVCNKHQSHPAFYTEKFDEIYNVGVAKYTRGTRHAEKVGKSMGLTPIGDAKIEDVFKKERFDPTPILEEGIKKLRHERLFK